MLNFSWLRAESGEAYRIPRFHLPVGRNYKRRTIISYLFVVAPIMLLFGLVVSSFRTVWNDLLNELNDMNSALRQRKNKV